MHKDFAFSEIKQDGGQVVTEIEFDLFGQYLAIGTTQMMTVCSYKNWKKTLLSLSPFDQSEQSEISFIRFDGSGRKIYVGNREAGSLRTLSLK